MKTIFKPNVDFLDHHNDKGKFILIWRLSLILSFLFALASILTYFSDVYSSILYLIALAICVFCFIHLNIFKKLKPIFWIFTISASSVVSFSMQTLIGTLHYPDFIWAICTIIFAYIGLGKKAGLFFFIFHLISACVFFTYTINIHLAELRVVPFGQQISVLFEMVVAYFALTYLINQYIHFQKYTENKLLEANEELKRKNKKITLLMKEIHHRIKNNLQLVVSLLRMQQNESKIPEMKEQFSEAINRVMSISIIHQKLYQKEDLKDFNLESYIQDLIVEIKAINEQNKEVVINLDVEVSDIGLKTLVPLGLLLNELITNSFKHAFANGPEKQIDIELTQNSRNDIELIYKDSGVWKISENGGFGLELIDLLCAQMEGKQKRNESEFNFSLRNLDLDES